MRIWADWESVSLTKIIESSLPCPDLDAILAAWALAGDGPAELSPEAERGASPSKNTSFPSQMTPSRSRTGRHSLKTSSACSQQASSAALATVADRPITCSDGFMWRNLVIVISRVGPRPGSF